MTLYEISGKVIVDGSVFIETDQEMTPELAAELLRQQLVGTGAPGLAYAESDTSVQVTFAEETDEIYTTRR